MSENKELLDSMVSITKEAAQISMNYFGHVRAHLKSDQSVITQADEEVQNLLFSRLRNLLPDCGFIGEESHKDPEALQKAREAEHCWVVDPIDGTAVFSSGIHTFGICVGLLRDGVPYGGVVAMPALGTIFYGMGGLGAYQDGNPICVRKDLPPLDLDFICLSRNSHQYFEIAYPGKMLIFGSTAYNFILVAMGSAVGAVGRSHVWDHVATAAIIKEAGGLVRHLDGREIDWRKALDGELIYPPVTAASAPLWDRVSTGVKILRD